MDSSKRGLVLHDTAKTRYCVLWGCPFQNMLWRTPYILWGYVVEYIYMLWRVYPVGYYMLWTTYIYCGDILWITATHRICCGLRYLVDDTFWVFSTTHTPCSPQHIYRRICCGDMLWSATTFTDVSDMYPFTK